GGIGGSADGVRQLARGDRGAAGRLRVPAERRRVLEGPDRRLLRDQVGRGDALGNHAEPGRVRHVLQRLIQPISATRNGRPEQSGRLFSGLLDPAPKRDGAWGPPPRKLQPRSQPPIQRSCFWLWACSVRLPPFSR